MNADTKADHVGALRIANMVTPVPTLFSKEMVCLATAYLELRELAKAYFEAKQKHYESVFVDKPFDAEKTTALLNIASDAEEALRAALGESDAT